MTVHTIKRTVDMQVIADWVEPRSRVLDLGCGRGVLLDSLVPATSAAYRTTTTTAPTAPARSRRLPMPPA